MATKALWHLVDCRGSGGKLGNRSLRGRPGESSLLCFPNRPHEGEPEPEQMNAIGESKMWLKWTYDVDDHC
jgi:hypothetical protein